MSKEVVKLLNGIVGLETSKPATMEQIEQAQNELGLKFAEDYVEYLLEYGAVSLMSTELMGIVDDNKYQSVVHETKEEKKYDNTVPPHMYVIENVGIDGLIVWQDVSGAVYYKIRFESELQKAADSLVDYIVNEVLTEE